MISIKILLLSIIYHLTDIKAVNVCDVGEIGYLSCTDKRALCVTLNLRSSNYTCRCEIGYEFNENSTKCIENFCSPDNVGYRFCLSEKATCNNDPTSEKGFICICNEGEKRDPISEMCEKEVANTTKVTVEPSHTSITEKQLIPSTTETTETSDIAAEHDVHSDNTVSEKPFIPSDINPCSSNSCTKNTTCVAIKDKYTCECKIGFIPKQDYQILIDKCSGSCDTEECVKNCDNVKVKKECYKMLIERLQIKDFTEGTNGWMISTIILGLFLIFSIAAIIYLIIRNITLRNNLKDNCGQQLIYNKLEQRCHPSEDVVRDPGGVVVISYVMPANKNKFNKGVPC